MTSKKRSLSVRERARARRQELENRRRQQRDLIERHQVAYFAARDDIDAVKDKITALEEELAALKAREADDTAQARHHAQMAMGALVVEANLPVEDVAVLLDASEKDVRKARALYRKHHQATDAQVPVQGVVSNIASDQAGAQETEPQNADQEVA